MIKIFSKIISSCETQEVGKQCPTVFRIRIRCTGVRWFFGLPDPDPDSTLIFSDSQDQEKYRIGTFIPVLKTYV